MIEISQNAKPANVAQSRLLARRGLRREFRS
jgi:hypothetical protein